MSARAALNISSTSLLDNPDRGLGHVRHGRADCLLHIVGGESRLRFGGDGCIGQLLTHDLLDLGAGQAWIVVSAGNQKQEEPHGERRQ